MDRRDFLKTSALAAAAALLDWEDALAAGRRSAAVGKPLKPWKKGEFQVHFIYTGVAESLFLIFPDGTSMLLDCGDLNALARGEKAVPVLPHPGKLASEWIARYVERVNPAGKHVDYMMLSHYHCDHGGTEKFHAGKLQRGGGDYFLSGFSRAAEFLDFDKAIDRCWPTYDDPIPLLDDSTMLLTHMRKFYDYMSKERRMSIEKFRLGATDQIIPLKGACPGFSVRNICANGRIAYPDGSIRDLYAERKKSHPERLNENGMSLGMVFSYGPFRFYTAGDFSDNWKLEDGSIFQIEDAMAEVCGPADVAKINHHGCFSMPEKLVSALQSRVWVSCVWSQSHNAAPTLARLSDRNLYPGDRIVCPGVFPARRREKDGKRSFMSDIRRESYEGSHIVLTVPKGGKRYSITYLSAADESMEVKSVLDFKTTVKP